jgi:hypothetical protein
LLVVVEEELLQEEPVVLVAVLQPILVSLILEVQELLVKATEVVIALLE